MGELARQGDNDGSWVCDEVGSGWENQRWSLVSSDTGYGRQPTGTTSTSGTCLLPDLALSNNKEIR
jgi:hypothetical protein